MTECAERVQPGPLVNQQPSRVTLYTADQFRKFPYLEQLRTVINDSFDHSNITFFSVQRLITKEQYLDILGDDTFTFTILSEPADENVEPIIYAVGSAHKYTGSLSKSEGQDIWVYVRPNEVDTTKVEEWELKILAINTAAKRNGLGAYMLKLLEDECKARFEEAHEKEIAESVGVCKCKLVLTTVQEINEKFYNRHGYRLDSGMFIDKGSETMGNWKEFHVASMSKDL